MSDQSSTAPVPTVPAIVRSVTVAATPATAFEIFTTRFAAWWPREHHIGTGTYVGAYVEPGVGGRWFERDADGVECDWGRVLEWRPPHQLRLSWHLNGEFEYDPDPERASEVEIHFIAVDASTTRVELTHRHFERAVHGNRLADSVASDGGWAILVRRYADLVEGRELTTVP
jgi:uncharacterized protein YndB with AHSA1/START domain